MVSNLPIECNLGFELTLTKHLTHASWTGCSLKQNHKS